MPDTQYLAASLLTFTFKHPEMSGKQASRTLQSSEDNTKHHQLRARQDALQRIRVAQSLVPKFQQASKLRRQQLARRRQCPKQLCAARHQALDPGEKLSSCRRVKKNLLDTLQAGMLR